MASFTVYKGSPDGTIVRSQTTRPPLLDDQVFIEVTASGLCGTDEHYKATDMALGYQGVGIVKGVGPNVKDFKEDHRVGWDYQHAACGHCNSYLTGRESYCPQRVIYGEASLDHLAIQYAAKMGCNIVVFSGSDNKRSEAMQLGAT